MAVRLIATRSRSGAPSEALRSNTKLQTRSQDLKIFAMTSFFKSRRLRSQA